MKRLFLILAILVFAAPAMAQTWHTANQGTIAWDASTTLTDGTPAPAGNVVKYQAYRRLSPALPSAGERFGAEIEATQQTISFSVEGDYFAGVSAVRYIGTERIGESAVAWSDNPAVCKDGQTFGFRYYLQLAWPIGLHRVQ